MKTTQEIRPERQAQEEIREQCKGEWGEEMEIKLNQHQRKQKLNTKGGRIFLSNV